MKEIRCTGNLKFKAMGPLEDNELRVNSQLASYIKLTFQLIQSSTDTYQIPKKISLISS